jgi:hypothetical protein
MTTTLRAAVILTGFTLATAVIAADVPREGNLPQSTANRTTADTSTKQPRTSPTTSPVAELVEPTLKSVFKEPVDTGILTRFKKISPGSFNIEPGKLELFPGPEKSSQIWVRPVQVGPVARLSAQIAFPALDKEEGVTEARLGFVLRNGKIVSVAFMRKRLEGKVNGTVRLILMGDNDSEKTIRTFPISGDLPSGEWTIYYHHGLVRATCSGSPKVQGFADVDPNTCPIIGVIFSQHSGSTSYKGFRFHASELPSHAAGAENRDLQNAMGATAESHRLCLKGNLELASKEAINALELWKKARGEEHPDVANAWFNLAVVCGARNDSDGAMKSYTKALSIREKTLGDGHPLTALLHLKVAEALVAQGKREEARMHLEKAFPVIESVFGKANESAREVVGRWVSRNKDKGPLIFDKDGAFAYGFVKQKGEWVMARGKYTIAADGEITAVVAGTEPLTLRCTLKDGVIHGSRGPDTNVEWKKEEGK